MTEHTSALSICCCQWGLMTTPLEGVADGCMDGGDGYPGMLCESEGWCWCICGGPWWPWWTPFAYARPYAGVGDGRGAPFADAAPVESMDWCVLDHGWSWCSGGGGFGAAL